MSGKYDHLDKKNVSFTKQIKATDVFIGFLLVDRDQTGLQPC